MNRKTKTFRFAHSALASAACAALMAGCGSSGGEGETDTEGTPPPAPVVTLATITGLVADGPLQGAQVCLDANDNAACDGDETAGAAAAVTGADGRFTLSVDADRAGRHAVVAMVPATAVDAATGQPVGTATVLRAPPTGQSGDQVVIVSPLSTAVADRMALRGATRADAAAQVQAALGLAASPLADYTAAGGDAAAALAARTLFALDARTAQLAAGRVTDAAAAQRLQRTVRDAQLERLAETLAASDRTSPAAKADEAAAAALDAMNVGEGTVAAVAAALAAAPTAAPDAPAVFESVRRFAYTDADNYSYTVFVGDSRQLDASGASASSEVRKTLGGGADVAFNRNTAYWTGSEWTTCERQWQVVTNVRQTVAADGSVQSSSDYCGASDNVSRVVWQDIAGQPMRDVVARIRAFPLPDSVGPHTDARGLPVNWGPDPAKLPAGATFPAGSTLSLRQASVDMGGTDRLELTSKPVVRWADGRYRQATTLEQYGGMPGDLLDAAAVPGNANTVFVFDVPLATAADPSLEAFKRWRAGFDMSNLKIRFYECDLRVSDQAAVNCAARGDGTLAITAQGDARVLRVAGGYPAALRAATGSERFWAERAGTVFRGARDLPRTRFDQRLNTTAWQALRTTLGIAAPAAPAAPAAGGPFETLRRFTFTDAANWSTRVFAGDSSVLDAAGYYTADDRLVTTTAGVTQSPATRNQLYWTGSTWLDCPVGAGRPVSRVNRSAPFDSTFCDSYGDRRTGVVTLTLDGRRMSDVVNDIRAYGSLDGGFDHANWGPNPATNPVLATSFFPAGSTMTYQGSQRTATPLGLAIDAGSRVRVAPAPNTTAPFASWPYAANLEEFVAKYPGDLLGGALNANTAFFLAGYDLPTPPSPAYTTRVEYRVAFDPNGQRARIWQNNRAVGTNFTTNYVPVLDTTYTVETVGGFRLLRFAALPEGFEQRFGYARLFGEREGSVWYGFKDTVTATPAWSVRLNDVATAALKATLGLP